MHMYNILGFYCLSVGIGGGMRAEMSALKHHERKLVDDAWQTETLMTELNIFFLAGLFRSDKRNEQLPGAAAQKTLQIKKSPPWKHPASPINGGGWLSPLLSKRPAVA